MSAGIENNVDQGGAGGASLYVAYPYTRPHYDGFLRSIVNLAVSPGYGELYLKPCFGYSLDIARHALIEGYRQSDADFMLFVDNDCLFRPEAVLRLLSHNLPMVVGCMYTRTLPPKPTIGHLVGKSKDGIYIYRFAQIAQSIIRKARDLGVRWEDAENDMLLGEPELLEVDGSGLHFALIRRDVIEALRAPYFVFQGSTTAGEDFFFCRKVKEAGFPIYVDLSVQTGHIYSEEGSYGIKELLYLTQYLDIQDLCDVEGSWKVGV